MRKQRVFTGVILLGLGLYFFLEQTNFTLFKQYDEWPTLLIISGAALLAQGYIGKDSEAILPGVLLFGLGIHFTLVHRLEIWPNHVEVFLLILATGFLLRYLRVKDGLFQGILFLLVALILLFYDNIIRLFPTFEKSFSFVWQFWPIIFIALGCYALFFKRR